jgi:hypothetical protein
MDIIHLVLNHIQELKEATSNNGGTCYFDRRDSSAYPLTDFVNKQLSFFPNMRIYWE